MANKQFAQHGQIRCGTISVSDLNRSLKLYQGLLGYQSIENGLLEPSLATSWGLPKMQGAPYAVLQAPSAGPALLRLIQAPEKVDFVPATSFGWTAFEITVSDVFALAESLADSDFKIVGPPKLVDGFTSFIPMQVYGPDGEILFLNQVNHSDEDADLPLAECAVDQLFIVVLAARDRELSAKQYAQQFKLDRAASHHIRYSLLNRAFALPADTQHTISMVQKGRKTFAQIDQLPEQGRLRPCIDGWLPPGNAMVSVWVDDIAELDLTDSLIAPVCALQGAVNQGKKSAVLRGSASEYIELIQIT
jgi:hypothetical protein